MGKAIQAKNPAAGSAQEFDAGFVKSMKAPVDGQCLVLPLVVKDKVAAVIYADAGTVPGGTLDSSGLQALTRFAAIWLELAALRKAGGSAAADDVAQPQPAAAMAASAPASAPASSGSEEDELHKKARRFAKLLVEEIKLYNQPRVEEGRQHKDLYERLKVDIERAGPPTTSVMRSPLSRQPTTLHRN